MPRFLLTLLKAESALHLADLRSWLIYQGFMLNHNHNLKLVSPVIFRDRVSSEFPVKTISLSSLITALSPPCISPIERFNVLTAISLIYQPIRWYIALQYHNQSGRGTCPN